MIREITDWQELVKPEKDLFLSWELVEEEYQELCDALESATLIDDEESRNHAAKEAADLIVVATRVLYDLGFDPEKVLEEVDRSNWSKLLTFSGNDAMDKRMSEKVMDYCHANNCEMKKVGSAKGWCGCFKENGKLAKGPFYRPVNFENFK